jgi:hypothetical protein|uniref:BZIP transcription factor n=1 Tax=Phaeodactylum tricornutum TaxID=2850 RepID=F8WL61_PHATR|nr:bZIP transcription factor [Phaeodactylum tricornutum]
MGEECAVTDPAEARKRRKAIIVSQRMESEANEGNSEGESNHEEAAGQPPAVGASSDSVSSSSPPTKKSKEDPGDNSKKTQIRYDPDVPMPKDQLAAWRREARRVRNRESAAASRAKIRCRITELETEVSGWKDKYTQAMERLEELQGAAETQKISEASSNTITKA